MSFATRASDAIGQWVYLNLRDDPVVMVGIGLAAIWAAWVTIRLLTPNRPTGQE